MTEEPTSYQRVLAYHEATKHHLDRYARSPGQMDWANQPNPFRFYEGCETTPLPFREKDPGNGHHALYCRETDSRPMDLAAIAGFLELAMGLSAWKAAGAGRWSLRMNPSSGNLHPTEAHLVLPQMGNLASGLYHYRPLDHALEKRAALPRDLWQHLTAHLGSQGLLVVLATIFWRESWKYGERAFRYCQLDTGHALAALAFSAAVNGWRVTVLGDLSHNDLGRLLGIDRTDWPRLEDEHPELAVWIHPARTPIRAAALPPSIIEAVAALPLVGRPNRLSRTPVDWEIIADAANATQKPQTSDDASPLPPAGPLRPPASSLAAAAIIRRRRSAAAYDPDGAMDRAVLEAALDKTLPRSGAAPFDAGLTPPAVDLVLFVHRVRGLPPGLYALNRTGHAPEGLKSEMDPQFSWKPVSETLPLFCLETGDVRAEAIALSCHQPIAGFSAFSLAMVARFENQVKKAPWRYRQLFWEAGMIGQVLYLEAEAHGFRGTGIGCYFDDAVHRRFGLRSTKFQDLYHFTVGVPREDQRLTTYAAYHHLEKR